MQKMCDDAVKYDLSSLQFVPDWFVTQQQIDILSDDNYVYNDNEISKLYDGCKKQKAQKVSIKEELVPIAWCPDRVKDWCLSEDKKRWWK